MSSTMCKREDGPFLDGWENGVFFIVGGWGRGQIFFGALVYFAKEIS